MNNEEIGSFVDSLLDKSMSEIEEQINILDEGEIYSLADHLIKIPYNHCEILVSIIKNLFGESDEFINLFCQFLEGPYQYCIYKNYDEIIKSIVLEKPDISFSIVKLMVNKGKNEGLSAGIILSMIYNTIPEADEFLKNGLKNEIVSVQRCSLVSLLSISKDEHIKNVEYFNILESVSPKISDENNFYLIRCLQVAFTVNPTIFQDVLEQEIVKRGSNAALAYIRSWTNISQEPISILKKAIQILESENGDEYWIDEGLAEVYEYDPSFVVERIRNRLHEPKGFKLMNPRLEAIIEKTGNEPIINLIESEIDDCNKALKYRAINMFENLFSSHEEWISWCIKWKEDTKKEPYILESLGLILTEYIHNYETNDTRDTAIQLVQYFAGINGFDYTELTKGINLGADATEGYENKEKTIKALVVLKEIISPKVKIDLNELEKYLNNAPCLCEAFGRSWLIKNAKKDNPHIINYIFSDDYSIQRQRYLENAFCILQEYGIKMKKAKLRDVDNGINILTEVEIISRLAPYFNISPEPDIEELKPKNLDLMIEYGGEKVLLEIATVEERLDVKYAHGAIPIPGGKVKKVLLSKFNSQLYGGNVDVGMPVIIVLNLRDFLTHHEVLNSINGALQFSYKTRTDNHETVAEGTTRANNGFYDEEKTEVVTAIAAYKQDINLEDCFVGKLYRSLRPPINKMSQKFTIRLRDALFGTSEISDWRTLMKISGIDEELASLFYSKGIDDIGVLANITENNVEIEEFDWQTLSRLKGEAIRVINALSTSSIEYLQGIDRDLYNILEEEGIYLITQLLEKEGIPEGIEEYKWNSLREDAKRILQ